MKLTEETSWFCFHVTFHSLKRVISTRLSHRERTHRAFHLEPAVLPVPLVPHERADLHLQTKNTRLVASQRPTVGDDGDDGSVPRQVGHDRATLDHRTQHRRAPRALVEARERRRREDLAVEQVTSLQRVVVDADVQVRVADFDCDGEVVGDRYRRGGDGET